MSDLDLNTELKKLAGMNACDFVLHREPMLFVDRVLDIGEDFAICEWRIMDNFEFNIPGYGVPSYAGIEFMAQCVAVLGGARARTRGLPPPVGYLLGTRHYRCSIDYFETGARYRAACEELASDSHGMFSYACHIISERVNIAEAKLAIFEVPQEHE